MSVIVVVVVVVAVVVVAVVVVVVVFSGLMDKASNFEPEDSCRCRHVAMHQFGLYVSSNMHILPSYDVRRKPSLRVFLKVER